MKTLDEATVALVADTVNLSIFNQVWLIKNGIITEKELQSGQAFHSPLAINISTSKYDLLIVPERIQVRVFESSPHDSKLLNRIVGNLVRTLPHTPYTAIGLNFGFTLIEQDLGKGLAREKELVLSNQNPLASYFGGDDSRFGMYMSSESLMGTRLRLDMKPVPESRVFKQSLQFNFHMDLNESNKIGVIESLLSSWDQFEELATLQASKLDMYTQGN